MIGIDRTDCCVCCVNCAWFYYTCNGISICEEQQIPIDNPFEDCCEKFTY